MAVFPAKDFPQMTAILATCQECRRNNKRHILSSDSMQIASMVAHNYSI